MSQDLLTLKDVQKRLKISLRTAYTLVKTGKLGGFQLREGGAWRFSEEDIRQYENGQRDNATKEMSVPA